MDSNPATEVRERTTTLRVSLVSSMVLNMGRAGWRSDNYANATQWYSPANALAAIAPAVNYVMLGLNDFNQNRSPVGFATSMATLVDKIEAAGSDAVLMVPMTPAPPAAERTYPWRQYREAIYDLASDRSLPPIDVGLRLGDYATAFAQGLITDELHPKHLRRPRDLASGCHPLQILTGDIPWSISSPTSTPHAATPSTRPSPASSI